MTRTLAALAALLLVACAGETRFVAPSDVDDTWIRDEVAAEWAAVGVVAPADYTLLFLDPVALVDACGLDAGDLATGTQLGGCSVLEAGAVLVNRETSPAQQVATVLHELGHVMRDDGRHLGCDDEADRGLAFGADVMCLSNAGPGGTPTARDAAFVRR